ncbi:MAG: S8 family serine peptidase [Prevotella sp.]|nr:S8 family serine peptidase [Prevotella sp.]
MYHRLLLFLFLTISLEGFAQRAAYSKMSPFVRNIVTKECSPRTTSHRRAAADMRELSAIVKVAGDHGALFQKYGCRSLLRFGDLAVVSIPLSSLPQFSLEPAVKRIASGRPCEIAMDSTAMHVNTLPVYAGVNLPQAYTGKGVVMGVQDIGFDLTHPNFYDSTATDYRIKAFWDQLSVDTVGSNLYVGNDYSTRESILAYAHSRDGLYETHGTHTLGIAAGSGYRSPYRGMAYESEMCVVSNAVSRDMIFIEEEDIYKYTYATDVLGFKYIFDYAKSVGKPCVISFSEGGLQDFYGYDQLYYEMIDSLVGPGRIIVVSAGNQGVTPSYIHKPKGRRLAGTFLQSGAQVAAVSVKSEQHFDLSLSIYGDHANPVKKVFKTVDLSVVEDSLTVDSIMVDDEKFKFTILAYPSCYNQKEYVYDVMVESSRPLGFDTPVSLEIIGEDADIELFRMTGSLVQNALNPDLEAAECTHNIFSPGSAPGVICVGGSAYRTHTLNYRGEWVEFNFGKNGERGGYSSVGPTYDGRVKPDVLAPGMNVISSYSSYYLENNPEAEDIVKYDVEHFTFNGRTYAWNSNSGTSMSTPVVAGAIALWLEAKPDLTMQDVMGVFARTCSHYDASLTYPNNYYGYGQIDVYRGLLDILGLTGIDEISTRHTSAQIRIDEERRVVVTFDHPLEAAATVKVFNLSGILQANHQVEVGGTSCQIPLLGKANGVYVVQITGAPSCSGSTLIRL